MKNTLYAISLFISALLMTPTNAENVIAFTSVENPFTGEKELLASGHLAHVFMLNGVSTLVARLNEVGKSAAGKTEEEGMALLEKMKPIVGTDSFKKIAEIEMKGRLYHKSLGLTQIPAVVINSGNTNYVVYGVTDLVQAYNALVQQRKGNFNN